MIAGACTFLNVYCTQPLLPFLQRLFNATEVQVSLTVGAVTLSVALLAPFTGMIAESIGRKKVIVPALFAMAVPTLLAAAAIVTLPDPLSVRVTRGPPTRFSSVWLPFGVPFTSSATPVIVLHPKPVPLVQFSASLVALQEGIASPEGVVAVSAPSTVLAVCTASAALGIALAATARLGVVVGFVTVGVSQLGHDPDGAAKLVTVPALMPKQLAMLVHGTHCASAAL